MCGRFPKENPFSALWFDLTMKATAVQSFSDFSDFSFGLFLRQKGGLVQRRWLAVRSDGTSKRARGDQGESALVACERLDKEDERRRKERG